MKKILAISFVITAVMFLTAPFAMAAEGEGASAAQYGFYSYIAIGCAIGLAVAAFGGSIGMGNAVNSALSGIARNPGASGKITTTLLIGLALIESLVIYTLVIALILLFVKPYGM
jgi:F-type H+-transporting ATPase subunit c